MSEEFIVRTKEKTTGVTFVDVRILSSPELSALAKGIYCVLCANDIFVGGTVFNVNSVKHLFVEDEKSLQSGLSELFSFLDKYDEVF